MQNLVSFLGIFVLIFIAWLLSEDRRRFPWRVVAWGLALQLLFGYLVLAYEPGARLFLKLNDVFKALLEFSAEGAKFVFQSVGHMGPGSLFDYLNRLGAGSSDPEVQNAVRTGTVPGFFFAFQILTTIIFFSALLSILYYLGIMQKVVLLFARVMSYTMGVSGAESLSNAANIFVGQSEAPLVIRPYIEKMTRSELMAIMVGGFANTAGGVLGAYIMMLSGYFPNIAAHLISASLLSAPAAFIFAKVMVPEREKPLTQGDVRMEVEVEDANLLDAVTSGTTVGWQLAINVGAMLLSFVALVYLVNAGVGRFGALFHDAAGVVTFDAMVAAAVGVLLWMRRRGLPGDTTLWTALAAIVVVHAGMAKVGGPGAARAVTLVLGAAWLTALLVSARKRPYGPRVEASLVGLAAAATIGFAIWGPLSPAQPLTLQTLLGWLHWPIAFVMGVPAADCLVVGRFLGEKLILTEFTAYLNLSAYLGAAARGEVPTLDPRSIVILSYALCGFANLASVGVQIGGIAPLAPSRRSELARLGFKAMVGGALATFMIACVAGTFYSGRSMLGLGL
jgi:concentrative nucleoside transporter, CNT family